MNSVTKIVLNVLQSNDTCCRAHTQNNRKHPVTFITLKRILTNFLNDPGGFH